MAKIPENSEPTKPDINGTWKDPYSRDVLLPPELIEQLRARIGQHSDSDRKAAELKAQGYKSYTALNSAFSIHEGAGHVDGMSANVASGIAQVNKETPLWSFHGEEDLGRLRSGDGTPKAYNVGIDKTGNPGGIEFRRNHVVPETPQTMGRNPFGDKSMFAARMEERFANARVDPHVAAFRTMLGQYHGLENPLHAAGDVVDPRHINLGELPKNWNDMAAGHLPTGSVAQKYVGDLYDADTLKYIDERGRNTAIRSLESEKFQWKPAAARAVTPTAETVAASATAHVAAPASPVVTNAPRTVSLPVIEASPPAPVRVEPVHVPPVPHTLAAPHTNGVHIPPATAESSIIRNAEHAAEQASKSGSGKTKWIVGGIVAGTVLLGSVIALNKKKSFTEREQERRQANSAAQGIV